MHPEIHSKTCEHSNFAKKIFQTKLNIFQNFSRAFKDQGVYPGSRRCCHVSVCHARSLCHSRASCRVKVHRAKPGCALWHLGLNRSLHFFSIAWPDFTSSWLKAGLPLGHWMKRRRLSSFQSLKCDTGIFTQSKTTKQQWSYIINIMYVKCTH